MSLAEEMLATMPVSSDSASYLAEEERHIVINESRQAIVPAELQTIAVTGDKDIETVTFDCVRYWDGNDLSTFAIYLNYVLPDKTPGTYIPEAITTSDGEDVYHFDWKIKNNITTKSGKISFAITAVKTKQNENGETVVDKQWSSLPNGDCSIALGIDISNIPSEEDSSEVLAQMSAILGQIQEDFDEWLKNNLPISQTTGDSETAVMSQAATTEVVDFINGTTDFENSRLFNKSLNVENSVVDNYYLLGNGCAKWDYDNKYCLDRLTVVSGETLYIKLPKDCEYVYQWQDRISICEKESVLDNRVIGKVSQLGMCGYITVPEGATALIVSRLKTSETVVQRPVYVDEALTNTEQIIKDFYAEDIEIKKYTAENYNLSTYGNGTIAVDKNYVIDRYDLGDALGLYAYLDISKDGKFVYQWQNTIACEQDYNRLDGRVIGTPQSEAFKGLVKVPKGASALIVARKKTSPENVVICKKKKDITIEDSKYIMDKAVAVSDTWKYTVGDGTQMVIDETRAIVYVLYNTDTSGYGESHRILALSVFPLKQPWRAKFFEVVKNGDTVGDYTITHMQDENLLMMDNAVRIFVGAAYTKDGSDYRGWLYIDFDKASMTCEDNFHQVKCTVSGVTSVMTAEILRAHIESKGYTTTDNYYVTLSSNLNKYNVWYAMITGGECEHPVFAVSGDDGATWILKGVLPITANFEAMCALVNGNVYAWVRPPYIAHETAYMMCISKDGGSTFTTFTSMASSNTRGQMLTYKDKLLIAHSAVNNTVPTDACANTRNNMTIWLGSGEKLSGYNRMIDFVNKYGILYYAIREYRGVLYMAYVSNDLYMSDGAKNLIYFTKIGELFTDGSPNEYV